MAATNAKIDPVKNEAYRVTFAIKDADGDLVTGATDLDSEVSLDGAGFSDCTNEAIEIATASGIYYLDLIAAEMNADTVAVIVKTSTVGAKTVSMIFYPVLVDIYDLLGDVNDGYTVGVITTLKSIASRLGQAGYDYEGNPIPDYMVSVGTFETQAMIDDNWTAINATLACVANGRIGNCLELTASGGNAGFKYLMTGLIVGKSYRASIAAKAGTAGVAHPRIRIARSSDDENIDNQFVWTNSLTWKVIACQFEARETSMWFEIYVDTAVAGTYLFDTAELRPLDTVMEHIYNLEAICTEARLAKLDTEVQADVKKINSTTLTGNGSTTPWGPA